MTPKTRATLPPLLLMLISILLIIVSLAALPASYPTAYTTLLIGAFTAILGAHLYKKEATRL